MTRIRLTRLALAIPMLLGLTEVAGAQIRRDPNGVNVSAQGATTVFITYGNLQGMIAVEAEWCGELIPATPAEGSRCNPATVFGRLPIRYDQSRSSGQNGFTDIMSIPASVARRAYQAAESGATSSFYYVRRFVDPLGLRPDEYVFVTCRLTGGGARTPFSLVDVRLAFETGDPVLSVGNGEMAPRVNAAIAYTGTGRLRGRWEVVFPGEELPDEEDLLTEATLPAELRGTQRRFTELSRFNVFLPPTGEFTLPGPDPEKVPTHLTGLHHIVLRIEAADDKEADSNLETAGAGSGVVHSGAVAGFPIPPLRYYVGTSVPIGTVTPAGAFVQVHPIADAELTGGEAVFAWSALPGAALYHLEIQNDTGARVLEALLPAEMRMYRAPPFLGERLGTSRFTWRVVALSEAGRPMLVTPWRGAHITPGVPPGSSPPDGIQP
jgi:hypothetical protein